MGHTMNVLIFGASGASGLHLVNEALARGHAVTAFVRDPARLKRTHAALRMSAGDVLDPASVATAVQGQEAVVCALGTMTEVKADRARRQRGVPVCSTGTHNIIQAMAQHGVRRIVVQSSASVGESLRTGKFGAGAVLRLLLHDVMQDKERQEALVRASRLDWTIIRPVKLSDAGKSGGIQSGEHLAWGLLSRISRADVAAFMLDAVTDTQTLRRAITLRA
jgi:putative NADH-flavin reductase